MSTVLARAGSLPSRGRTFIYVMSIQVERYGHAIAWEQKASLSIPGHFFGDAVHHSTLVGLLFLWEQSDMMFNCPGP